MIEKTIRTLDMVNIALEAGTQILEVYHSNTLGVEVKDDDSPLTMADKRSHLYITEQLANLYPNIPIISEEGELPEYEIRKQWTATWLIDPLDGTKEFIKRNGEFTVNIGLVENGTPVLGVIYSPAQDVMYFASRQIGSYKITDCIDKLPNIQSEEALLQQAQKLPLLANKDSYVIAVSRSHFSEDTQNFITEIKERIQNVQVIEAGSSIKMCLVAEGTADIYPRLSYSMEWDTAAGEAIVKYSGGEVFASPSNEPLAYNKPNLKNPFHIVKRMGAE